MVIVWGLPAGTVALLVVLPVPPVWVMIRPLGLIDSVPIPLPVRIALSGTSGVQVFLVVAHGVHGHAPGPGALESDWRS